MSRSVDSFVADGKRYRHVGDDVFCAISSKSSDRQFVRVSDYAGVSEALRHVEHVDIVTATHPPPSVTMIPAAALISQGEQCRVASSGNVWLFNPQNQSTDSDLRSRVRAPSARQVLQTLQYSYASANDPDNLRFSRDGIAQGFIETFHYIHGTESAHPPRSTDGGDSMRSIHLHFLTPDGSEATPQQLRLSALNMHPSSDIPMERYDSNGPLLFQRPPERFADEFLRNPFDHTSPVLELALQPKAADLWNLGNSLHVLLSGEEFPWGGCPPKTQHYFPSGHDGPTTEQKFWGRPRLNAFIRDMFPSTDEHGERRFMQLFLCENPNRVVVPSTLDIRYLLLVAVMVKCLHPYAPCRLRATQLFAEKKPIEASLLDLNNVSDSASCNAFLRVISWFLEDHNLSGAPERRLGQKSKRENEVVLPRKAIHTSRVACGSSLALRLCDNDVDDSGATIEVDEDEFDDEPSQYSELDDGYLHSKKC